MHPDDLTLRAAEKIAAGKHVFVKSAKTAAGAGLVKKYPHVVALDDCFDKAQNFDELCAAVCDTLLSAEKEHGEVLYVTDGDGMDACVTALRTRTDAVEMVYGVAANRSRGADTSEVRLTASDALVRRPYLDTTLPLHITEIDDEYLAGELKLWLGEYYGDETRITVSVKGKTQTIPLCELDRLRGGYGETCEMYIAAQEGFYKDKYAFGDLMRIMRKLTSADGCPWDKAQTHESIRVNMIEEAYEAVDAIDAADIDAMTEELGDVLLQAVFHCDMGRRFGEFDLCDVLGTLCDKLVFRHTHIFGANKATNADEALSFWEAAKSEEKSYVSTVDKLERLPSCFPALLAAQKVYKKLVKAGVQSPVTVPDKAEYTEELCGNKLFWLAAAMSEAGVDPEVALSSYLQKMKRAFAAAEQKGEIADFFAAYRK